MTIEDFRRRYEKASGADLSPRQAYRWVAGELQTLPYPHAQAALERLFDEPAARLFGPPYGTGPVLATHRIEGPRAFARGNVRTDWQGQVIAMSGDRARDFLRRAEASNVGRETIDQLADDVRRLVVEYQQQPLERLLGEIADTQSTAFGLLDGRQKPEQTRDLYLLAGVVSGVMAKASHDLGAPHDAMTQARAAYTCANNAGHDGLRAWARGVQSLIAYWSGQFHESVACAAKGAEAAARSRGSASVWLASSRARSLAALGRLEEAHEALDRASEARERMRPDELDQFGGLCTFSRPRELYYAADALAWGGVAEARHTERLALEALTTYDLAPATERAFGDESGTRCDLAIARILQGQLDGTVEALTPVLQLPVSQRIHGIVSSVHNVHRELRKIAQPNRQASDLDSAIENFTAERLMIAR